MNDDANTPAAGRVRAELQGLSGPPSAPLAMPKQVLELQPNWLFAIYARLVRRY
jgi:hypothetical protein